MINIADEVRSLAKELRIAREETWEEAKQDMLLLFPNATVYLMSKVSDDKFREKYSEQVEGHESFFAE